MSDEEIIPNDALQENQDINTSEPKNLSLNNQIQSKEKNIGVNGSLKNEELKIGQFLLTPLQSILLNKKFPSGFKLETEENYLKSLEIAKALEKKNKQALKLTQQRSQRSNNSKYGQNSKKIKSNNNIDHIPNNTNPEKYKIYKQCKGGFEKIRESKYFAKYYTSSDPKIPSLSVIEKKINNKEYSSLYQFEMDVRNIWSYYFNLNPNDEIAKKMSEDWEKICTDLENPNSDISVSGLKDRTNNLKKEIEKFKEHREDAIPAPTKKSGTNSDQNRPMSVEDKNQLGNDIRSLNKEQLKGIIKILSESDTYPKSKYFEFDIDKLSNKKLRELEKYVSECISKNNKGHNQTANNNNNLKNQTKENTNNKNNNATTNTNNNAQQHINQSNSKNKEINKTYQPKTENSGKKKITTDKKQDKKDDFSSSDSVSSDSSLSN